MHETETNKGTIFNHNSDFSGEIIVRSKSGKSLHIPGEDIIQFVVENYIIPKKIAQLEQMNYKEYLNQMDMDEVK